MPAWCNLKTIKAHRHRLALDGRWKVDVFDDLQELKRSESLTDSTSGLSHYPVPVKNLIYGCRRREMLLTIIEWGRKVNEMKKRRNEMKSKVHKTCADFLLLYFTFVHTKSPDIVYFVITRAVSRDESTCTFIHEIFWNEWIIAVVNLHAIFFSVLFSPRRGDSLSLELGARVNNDESRSKIDQSTADHLYVARSWCLKLIDS